MVDAWIRDTPHVETDGRRWSRSSGVLIVVGIYLSCVAVAAALALVTRAAGLVSRDSSWWLAPAMVAIGLPLSVLTSGWVTRRHIRHDVVECAIRAEESGARTWRHGRVQKTAGELVFVSGGPSGMRFPRGKPCPFPISYMSEDGGQRPALRQVWSINPTLHIVRVMVDDQALELAALPGDLDRLRHLASLSR